MFGYVKVFAPELKVREYEVYKAVYCSLCRTLGKRYGFAARMTLSYDFTFLALFMMALRDEKVSFEKGRCPIHPLKKRLLCNEEVTSLDYAADVAMLLIYHKLDDSVRDERFLKSCTSRVLRRLYTHDYRKAAARRPREARVAEQYMAMQRKAEETPHIGIDAAAEPTAMFLSSLMKTDLLHNVNEDDVARFAYCLGRFIYLADAVEDMEADAKSGNFNPYILSQQTTSPYQNLPFAQIRSYAAESLHACVGVCAEVYENLPIKRFDGILRNVIFHGMPSVIARISQGKQEESLDEQSV